MRHTMHPRPESMPYPPAPSRRQAILATLVDGVALPVLALLVIPAILCGKNLSAQTLSAQTHAPQATKPEQQQKAAARPTSEAIAAQPPASLASILPSNQPPNPARISWDSRGLEIDASNSSLEEILRQVAAETGARLEGVIQNDIPNDIQDQRIFGRYGPGPGCDVLSQLLDGSGYNVLMIGSRGANAPLEIILSTRLPASPRTAANTQSPPQLEPEPQPIIPLEPPPAQPTQDPFRNGGPPREPLQFMQEILDRQHQIDQQQQQQPQNNSQQ